MFKELDIRGRYPSEVNETNFFLLGIAAGKACRPLVAGMDYRRNNKALFRAFSEGFGYEISFLGAVPTPTLAFSSRQNGLMLTASHNPAEYAGAKFFRHRTYFSRAEMDALKAEYGKISAGWKEGKTPAEGKKNIQVTDSVGMVDEYLNSLPEIKGGVYDLAGGAACALRELFEHRLFDVPDPEYQSHSPEPKDATLDALKGETLKRRKTGFAFDGDGDRLQVVDAGTLVEADVVAAFICEKNLKGNDRVVLSVDCRQEVFEFAENAGIKVITSKVGDAYVVEKGLQVGAIFSAERSGHFTFYHHAPNSDGIYAAAVLSGTKSGEVLEFAKGFRNVTLKEEVWFKVDFEKLKEKLEGPAQKISTIDGIKAEFGNFTLLIRQSTTEPKIRVNSEAQTMQDAKAGMRLAREMLSASKA